jgi:hypothetical protein
MSIEVLSGNESYGAVHVWWFVVVRLRLNSPSFLSFFIENHTRLAEIKSCPLIVFYFNYSPYFFIVFYFFNPFFD